MQQSRSGSRARLLGSVCVAAAMFGGAGGASAQSVIATDVDYIEAIEQLNQAFDLSSTIGTDVPGVIEIDIDDIVTDSTLLVGGAGAARNIISANLAGNEASGTLTSSVTNDLIGDVPVTGNAASGGTATVANANLGVAVAQAMNGVTATAGQTTSIGIVSEDVVTSSLAVLNNVQEAIGVMNRATTALSSDTNSTNASSAVIVAQSVAGGSSLTVSADAVASIDIDGVAADTAAQSQLTLAGNTQRAIGVGNIGTNALVVTANDITALTFVGPSITTAVSSDVSVAGTNALASTQNVTGADMVAEVAPTTEAFLLSVTDGVTLSALNNSSNTALANLRGNAVTNTLTLDATNAQTFPDILFGGTIASLANSQSVNAIDGEQIIASVVNGVRTNVGGLVTDSTVTTSSNRIEAASTGNIGANAVDVTVTNLDTTTVGGSFASTASGANASAAIGLASNQSTTGEGEILATLSTLDGTGVPTDGAMIVTNIDDAIANSSVVSDGNALVASATGNEISANTNAITVSGTNVATSTALSNLQNNGQQITAVVGAPGTDFVAGTPGYDFTLFGEVADGTWEANEPLEGVELAVAIAFFEQSYQNVTHTNGVIQFDATLGQQSGSYLIEVAGSGDTLATPQSGGVVAQLGGTLTSSTVSVGGNMTSGSATGNIATNRIAIAATNLGEGTFATTALASPFTANADHALANDQSSTGDMSTDVAATFAIDADLGTYGTTASDLSVSDNQQFATTRANVVTNAVSLTATNLDTSGAISSNQNSGGILSSTSDMDVFAPASMANSTLALDGNRNEAVTTANTAGNSLTVDTTNLTSISAGANADVLSDIVSWMAEADFALGNTQTAVGATEANASSMVVNEEGALFGDVDTTGIVGSTASLSYNVTLAEGTANRANNAMTLSSGAEFGGTGAIVNDQTATGSVDANAQSVAGLDLSLDPLALASSLVANSALTVQGNVAAATARGNVATSALSVSGLDLTADGGVAIGSADSTDGTALSASHAVLNDQESFGSITATSDMASSIALEGGQGLGNTLEASTLSVTGNGSVADAAGNVSANSLALNGGGSVVATGLVGSNQSNEGAISSVASSASGIMLNSTDAATALSADNSTLTVSGNQTVAQARANVATNVLNASGLSLADTAPTATTVNASSPGVNASTNGLNFAVLNGQSNTAGVSAMVTSAVYEASASNTGFGALNASGVGVSGNVVQASATGNSATNLVDLAALNHSGGTAGIASSQVNSGDIMASVTSARTGSVLSGSVLASSVGVGGNTISSSAVGNSVASTLIRN